MLSYMLEKFLPHCTHKLQPFEVAVKVSLSVYLDQALKKWLKHHPGRMVTVFQISQVFKIFPISKGFS